MSRAETATRSLDPLLSQGDEFQVVGDSTNFPQRGEPRILTIPHSVEDPSTPSPATLPLFSYSRFPKQTAPPALQTPESVSVPVVPLRRALPQQRLARSFFFFYEEGEQQRDDLPRE